MLDNIVFIFAVCSNNNIIGLAIWFSALGDVLLKYDAIISVCLYIMFHLYISLHLQRVVRYNYSPFLYMNFIYMIAGFVLGLYFWVGVPAIFCFFYTLLLIDNLLIMVTNSLINYDLLIGYMLYIISDLLALIGIYTKLAIVEKITHYIYYAGLFLLSNVPGRVM
jgi:hypothetical protein